MADGSIQLTLEIELDDDAYAEELEAALESLRADLCEAPVEVDRPPAEEAPSGSKGIAASAFNVLVITGNAVALELAVDYVKDWLSRRRRSRVKLRGAADSEVVIMLPGVSEADARHLIARLSRKSLA